MIVLPSRLQELLASTTTEAFLSQHFESKELRSVVRVQYRLDDFEHLLWAHERSLHDTLTACSRQGAEVPPRRAGNKDLFGWAVQRYRSGSALHFADVHCIEGWAARLAGDCALHLRSHVSIDALAVPPDGDAVDLGFLEAPDCILIQATGSISFTAGGLSGHKTVLEPGDCLYIPNFESLTASARAGHGVCFIVQVNPLSIIDLAETLAEVAGEADARLRETAVPGGGASLAMGAHLLRSLASSPEIMRRSADRLILRLADEHKPAPGGHMLATHHAMCLHSGSILKLRTGVILALENHAEGLYVYIPGAGGIPAKESQPSGLLFPAGARELLEAVATKTSAFCAADLPQSYSDQARLATLRALMTEGVLEMAEASPQ
ncbi:hypothetical protein LJR260_001617 [Variovorax paradoxus]|uniref:hypothetical protein n=1 Tax=Variovorax paradoxus TaxID=34073 RepID=UPI003ECD9AB1